MSAKQLTEYHLEVLSLKIGCTGSSESTLVKLSHCWKSGNHRKSHVAAQTLVNTLEPGYSGKLILCLLVVGGICHLMVTLANNLALGYALEKHLD